jgi:hypothetical protein
VAHDVSGGKLANMVTGLSGDGIVIATTSRQLRALPGPIIPGSSC